MYPNTDWWYTYPPEKWWSSSDWIIIQFLLAKIKSMVQTTNQLLDIYINKKQLMSHTSHQNQSFHVPKNPPDFPPKKIHRKKKKSPPSCRHPRPQAGDEVLQVGHGDVARGAAAWRDRTGRWKVVEFGHEKMGILPWNTGEMGFNPQKHRKSVI